MLGKIRPIEQDRSLNEFVASSAISIAHQLTFEAMEDLGRESEFLPNMSTPKDAPLVVAYSLFILAGIQGNLESEGIYLEFKEIAVDTASLFYLYHPEKEKSENT